MPLNTSEIVGERYRVVKLLGQGGMGAVYQAWDLRLNRPVALKEMVPQPGLDANMLAQLRQQFKQEAQVLGTLVHPSLVRVTDYFSWGNNEYLVMDFVEGESLAERMEREGAQPEPQVLAWTGQLLEALSYCHGQGVIHRDIKPQNIVVTPKGRAVLVDFGLVKLWDSNDPRTRTVMRGAGTPEYAPPEQYDMGLGHTDPRSDIYGLGATIYHALTGQVPPTATQRMASPASFAPPRRVNATISPTTEAVVLKALAMAMDERYQSADEMAQALGVAPRISPAAPRRTTRETREAMPPTEAEPPARRGVLLGGVGLVGVGLLCLALAVGAVLVGLYIFGGDGAAPATDTPWPTATRTPQPTGTPQPPTTTPIPATATLRPINTPGPAPAPGGGVLFEDDFGDPDSGWEVGDYEGGSVGYGDGIYFVRGEEDGSVMWGVLDRPFDDLVIEVDATQVLAPANDNNAYGVKCREQPNGDGYGLMVSGDGYYSIQVVVDGDWDALVEWTESDAVHQGNATNHIRAVCEGTHLALFVNGEFMAETDDSTYSEGSIAFAASTLETEPTEVHFDNLVVRRPVTVLFEDDFGDSGSGWEVGDYESGSVGYKDGIYFVRGEEDGSVMWGVLDRPFDDLVIEVDATQVLAPANDNNAYGVKCREQPDGDGYGLMVSGDGYYSIQVVVDGDWEPLVAWTESDAVHQGNATNHIRAVCEGTHLALFVNGELLAEAEDSTYSEGSIAFAASTLESEPTEVHFDSLLVFAP